jgi:hemerythrin
MNTLAWSELLELGHPRIDAEHRALLDAATEIESVTREGAGIAILQPLYKRFHRMLVAHCAYEETLLRSLPRSAFGFQVDIHCEGHVQLIEQARSVAEGSLPDSFDCPKGFAAAYFQLMHDLLIDDAELIGALIREGRHSMADAHGHSSAVSRHPPI